MWWMKINTRGYWETKTSKGHAFDESLCAAIVEVLRDARIATVLDVGCGMGDYARRFLDAGFACQACDGNPNTPRLTRGLGSTQDVSEPVDFGTVFDCVMSLEVGEHIPAEYEQVFVDNLCRHAGRLLILSWAVPGQSGDGHCNCRSNADVVADVVRRGFEHDEATSATLRARATKRWFKGTVMVFRR